MVRLSDEARKEGTRAVERSLPAFRASPFLKRAMELTVEGVPGTEIEAILEREIAADAARARSGAAILRRAADVAPAMGLIGTLVGLIQMLKDLSDPSTIGPGLSLALLTTLYGAVLGSMIFAPLAAKLERRAQEEALEHCLYANAAAAIARQDNPRRLQTTLNAVLPPEARIAYFK